MKLLPRLIAPLLAAGLAFVPVAAVAAPGVAAVNVNVRTGPGLGFHIVDVLEKGEYVIVKECGAAWCRIDHIGNDGYVARTLLFNPYYGSEDFYEFPPKHPQPGRD